MNITIGAAWKSKKDDGRISVKLMDTWVTLYPNDRKTSDKQPDYNLVWNNGQEKKDKPADNVDKPVPF